MDGDLSSVFGAAFRRNTLCIAPNRTAQKTRIRAQNMLYIIQFIPSRNTRGGLVRAKDSRNRAQKTSIRSEKLTQLR